MPGETDECPRIRNFLSTKYGGRMIEIAGIGGPAGHVAFSFLLGRPVREPPPDRGGGSAKNRIVCAARTAEVTGPSILVLR